MKDVEQLTLYKAGEVAYFSPTAAAKRSASRSRFSDNYTVYPFFFEYTLEAHRVGLEYLSKILQLGLGKVCLPRMPRLFTVERQELLVDDDEISRRIGPVLTSFGFLEGKMCDKKMIELRKTQKQNVWYGRGALEIGVSQFAKNEQALRDQFNLALVKLDEALEPDLGADRRSF